MAVDRVRMRIVVSGRVQGVGFRYATVTEARRLGLVGWTRNAPDGSVEIVAEGELADIRALVAWCQTGPPMARVRNVVHAEVPRDTQLNEFGMRW